MINKFRKKFMLLSMVCVTIVILVFIFSVHQILLSRYNANMRGILNKAVHSVEPLRIRGIRFNGSQAIPINIFKITMNRKGEIISYANPYGTVKKDKAIAIFHDNYQSLASRGTIKEESLFYDSKMIANGKIYGFIDVSGVIAYSKENLGLYLIFGSCGLVVFFMLSYMLSIYAVKPVKEALDQQAAFVSNASHELKTPLTVILANISLLDRNKNQYGDQDKNRIENINAETIRMQSLVKDLLYLANTYDNKCKMLNQRVSLNEVIMYCALQFEAIAFEKQIDILTDITDESLTINGHNESMKQLIMILLDNAYKYANCNANITLTLERDNNKGILTVHNTESYIASDAIDHVFERFYRSSESRHEYMDSTGLGLSIAKEIVNVHHGKIDVKSTMKEGTTFIIRLPLKS